MKKTTITFFDKNRSKATIDIEIKDDELTMSGECDGNIGQCYDEIMPKTRIQHTFLDIWKKHHLKKVPKSFEKKIIQILDTIRKEEQYIKENYVISDEDREKLEDDKIQALMKALNLSEEEVQYIEEYSDHISFNYGGTDYLVGTEEEMNDKALEYLNEDMWIESVKGKNTQLGYEDWQQNVIDCDGYGSILNSYDGSYEETDINGVWYYIIRN